MLAGRKAIVTGASRGIGRAAALVLAENGADVLITGTNRAKLDDLADRLRRAGSHVVVIAGDVTDPGVADEAVRLAIEEFAAVDILINSAGINARSATLDMAFDDWQRVIDVNLNGTLHFCQAVLPEMIRRGAGSIVNISSTASKTPHRNASPAYGASKAAVNYLTMHLAREMAPHGIRVNAVCPGPVETDMTADWSVEYRGRVLGGVPLGRMGAAREIADVAAFLASDKAAFITGETVNVNGGSFIA